MLAGDDLDQDLAPDLARRLEGRTQLCDLSGLEFGRIVGMVEGKHLDAVVDRPVDEAAAEVLAEFEGKRP